MSCGHTHPAEIIQRKRDGRALSGAEIRAFVAGVVAGDAGGVGQSESEPVGDAQLGAFLMAVCCRGMDVVETAELTLAMRDSGVVVDLSSIAGRKIDKHSTGGVGDKVSLVLAPLVAAAGVPVPMISGRGLGHTGGTLDKLAAIPGYRTELPIEEFVAVLRDCGYVMSGASADLAPADRRMYAVRDVTGTVESVALITSSILAKKLASGLDGLVMDVKVGRAAFMKDAHTAKALMKSLVHVGQQAGKPVRALMTDMDTPLGRAVGNALEIRETIDSLRGAGPADLLEVVLALGGEMLVLAGHTATTAGAEAELRKLLESGAALDCFRRNVERQGGDGSIVDQPDRLPAAPVKLSLSAPTSGFVADLDPLAIGKAVVDLGGGRRQPTDDIDVRVGVMLHQDAGDEIVAGQPWAEIHAGDSSSAAVAAAALSSALEISVAPPTPRTTILARM